MPRDPIVRRIFRLPWRTASQLRADVDEELGFHLEMRADDLVAAGLPADEARRHALREFGDLEYTRAYLRDVDLRGAAELRRAEWLGALRQDVAYAWRKLAKHPAFTLAAVLTLALGIGANSAIFSVVRGVLLRPLPYAGPERIVRLYSTERGQRTLSSPLDVLDFRAQSHAFSSITAIIQGNSTLTAPDADAERVNTAWVSSNLLATLGVPPLIGGTFTPRAESDTPPREVLLAESLWRRRFGADPSIVGRTITVDGAASVVRGVLPAGKSYPPRIELWRPIEFGGHEMNPHVRGARFVLAIARLAPGATIAAANDELRTIAARLEHDYAEYDANVGAAVVELRESLVGSLRTPLLVLLGAVGFVLLIACANVANLLLVRAAARETEIAVRAALGAARARIVRQLVTESVMLALLGGAAAALLAGWGTSRLVALAPQGFPRLDDVHVDAAVLGVTMLVAVLTGVLFGLIPALHASRSDPARVLREGGRGVRTERSGRRLRRALVIAEMALSIVLLAGAGLLLRSFARLQDVDPGFRAERVVTFAAPLNQATYENAAHRRAFALALLEQLRGIPGVQSAALASGLPLGNKHFLLGFDIDGRAAEGWSKQPHAEVRMVSDQFFETLGFTRLRGRVIEATDRPGVAPSVVVNEATVRRYFPHEDPIGKTIRFGFTRPIVGTIVGIVADTRELGLDREPQPEAWFSNAQYPAGDLDVVLRSALPPSTVIAAARERMREIDAGVPMVHPRPVAALVSDAVSQPRFFTWLLGVFAAVAVVLAAVGMYGVISYAVTQRAHELGIRVALGATPRDVLRLVIGEGVVLTLVGVAIGLAGALWTTRLITSLLFGVTPTDPMTFVAGAVLLVTVSIVACWLPARRAARVDPLITMRADG